MKRKVLLTCMMLLGAMFAFQNASAQEGIKVGFRASPLVAWANVVDESTKTKPIGLETGAGLGFSFDFVVTYGLTESVALRSGVNIATKSVNYDQSFGDSLSIETRQSFTAVEIPIGLKFRSPEIGDGMYVVGFFGLNPEINLQNRAKTDVILGDGTITSTETVDSDDINLFTMSFVPGVGMDWEFDWGMLEFAATYHWGLLSYTDTDPILDGGTGLRSRLNYIALNIGYFF